MKDQGQSIPIKRVEIYCRVSTLEQAEKENSLDSQVERCRRLISLHEADGWLHAEIFKDAGFSGGSMDRPSLKEMLADAERGAFDVIALYKLDRLTRNIRDFHKLWEKLERLNVSIVAASQEINTATPSSRLMFNRLVSFAEFERSLIAERTSVNMDHKFNSGDCGQSMASLWAVAPLMGTVGTKIKNLDH